MKLHEIIKSSNWLSVEIIFLKLYPEELEMANEYKSVFGVLKEMEVTCSELEIIFEPEVEENDVYVSVFGLDKTDGTNYGIFLEPWSNWLGMEIEAETLIKYTGLEIISHCLYEMTFHGFDEITIQNFSNDLQKYIDK